MTIKVGVLAVQGSFLEHIKSLEKVKLDEKYKHLDILVSEIRTVDDVTDDLSGLIIPGGESTTMLRFLDDIFLVRLRGWIVEHDRPVWGSCAGMILLADAVSGIGVLNAVVTRNYFGRQRQSFTQNVTIRDDKLRRGGLICYPGVFIRAPAFLDIGEETEVLATLSTGPGPEQAVAVKQANILATAFHPELTEDDRFHLYFMDMVVHS
eukprot:GFUD01019905.1.p1 GENE.GFUD01019905.1~~GFUD01019905.1.p1  ORF type:complete len:208 (-),score=56.92 GFUD01019905.1:68-691(-)